MTAESATWHVRFAAPPRVARRRALCYNSGCFDDPSQPHELAGVPAKVWQACDDGYMPFIDDDPDDDTLVGEVACATVGELLEAIEVLTGRQKVGVSVAVACDIEAIHATVRGKGWRVDTELGRDLDGPTVTASIGGPGDPGVLRRLRYAADAIDGAIRLCKAGPMGVNDSNNS